MTRSEAEQPEHGESETGGELEKETKEEREARDGRLNASSFLGLRTRPPHASPSSLALAIVPQDLTLPPNSGMPPAACHTRPFDSTIRSRRARAR
jgi:hypothetical protein